jgi:hypothetical protein
MFRKVILVSLSLVFAGGVLLTSVYRTSVQAVNEKLALASMEFTVKEADETGEEASPTVAGDATVDYTLTWPGILPDHFLYPLKMIRDRVWLLLATNPLKKAELMLKFADKRLWAAEMLAEREKYELAGSTATKAEKYLEMAVAQEKLAREKGEETTAFLDKLSLATRKHEEVLMKVRERTSEEVRPIIESSLEYPRRAREEVKNRLGK